MLRKFFPYGLLGVGLLALLLWNHRVNYGPGRASPDAPPEIAAEVARFAEEEKLRAVLGSDDALIRDGTHIQLVGRQVEIELDALRDCYAQARWDDPSLADGKVAVRFRVTSSPLSPPRIIDFSFYGASSTIHDQALYACIERASRDWKIAPKLRIGQQFEFTFTFESLARGASGRGKIDEEEPPPIFQDTRDKAEVASAAQGALDALQDDPFAVTIPEDDGENAAIDGGSARALLPSFLSERQIGAIIEQRRDEIEYCRAKAIQRGIAVGARPSIDFMIAADGSVDSILEIESGTSSSPLFDDCLREAILSWRFPPLVEAHDLRARHVFELDEPRPSRPSRARRLSHPFGMMFWMGSGDDLDLVFEKPRKASLTEEQVAAVVAEHLEELHACLDGKAFPKSAREIGFSLRFSLDRAGSVKGHGMSAQGLPDGSMDCLNGVVKGWLFPPLAGSGSVRVIYPFDVKRSRTPRLSASRAKDPRSPAVVRTFEIVPRSDEMILDEMGARHSIEMAIGGKLHALRGCRTAEIALTQGPLHPIPLYFEIAPDGHVLPKAIELGVRERPLEDGGKGAGAFAAKGDWRASSDAAATRFERCISNQVAGWKFTSLHASRRQPPGFPSAPRSTASAAFELTGGGRVSVRVPVTMASPEELGAEIERQAKQLKRVTDEASGGSKKNATGRERRPGRRAHD